MRDVFEHNKFLAVNGKARGVIPAGLKGFR